MDYQEIYGEKISERDAEFGRTFSDFVNGQMSNPKKVGKYLAKEHRYLQGQMWSVCLSFMRQLALNYHRGWYDDRNEYAAKTAAKAYDSLIEADLIFDIDYIERKID